MKLLTSTEISNEPSSLLSIWPLQCVFGNSRNLRFLYIHSEASLGSILAQKISGFLKAILCTVHQSHVVCQVSITYSNLSNLALNPTKGGPDSSSL